MHFRPSDQASWVVATHEAAFAAGRSAYLVSPPLGQSSVPRRAAAIRRSSPVDPSVDRPAPTLDDPAGTSPYSHWKAWPSPHLHPNRSSLDVSPHVPTPATMACTIGSLTLSSRTATVLAHGHALGPALPHRHPSCPTAPQTGTFRTPFCTPGSAAPLLHSPAPLYA